MPSPHFPEAASLFNVMCSEQQEHRACFPQSIFHLISVRFHNSPSLTIPLAWLVEEPSLWALANCFHRGVERIHLVNMLITSFSVSGTAPLGGRAPRAGRVGRKEVKNFQGPGLESWDVESLHLRRHLRDVAFWQNWHLHLCRGVVGVQGLHRLYALAPHSCASQVPSPFDRQ